MHGLSAMFYGLFALSVDDNIPVLADAALTRGCVVYTMVNLLSAALFSGNESCRAHIADLISILNAILDLL